MAKDRTAVVTAAAAGRTISCLVCGEGRFWQREILLNSPGAEFFGFAWANRSTCGLFCETCGHLHEFLWEKLELTPAG